MSENDDQTTDNVVRVAFGGPTLAVRSDPADRDKLEVFSKLIDQGMVLVSLDARPEAVAVPPQHKDNLQLALNFSHRFGLDDFAYDERGVRASLSFNRQPFFCDIPWSAVFLMRSQVTGEVVLFPSSLPPEMAPLLAGIEEQIHDGQPQRPAATAPERPQEPPPAPKPGERPTLRLVKG